MNKIIFKMNKIIKMNKVFLKWIRFQTKMNKIFNQYTKQIWIRLNQYTKPIFE